MRYSVRIKSSDAPAVAARSVHARRGAMFAVAENVLSDATPMVPMLSGDLRTSGRAFVSSDDLGVVEWGGSLGTERYARAQFHGTNGRATFRNYTTPGTGPKWTERAEAERADEWRRIFAAMYGRGLRG